MGHIIFLNKMAVNNQIFYRLIDNHFKKHLIRNNIEKTHSLAVNEHLIWYDSIYSDVCSEKSFFHNFSMFICFSIYIIKINENKKTSIVMKCQNDKNSPGLGQERLVPSSHKRTAGLDPGLLESGFKFTKRRGIHLRNRSALAVNC